MTTAVGIANADAAMFALELRWSDVPQPVRRRLAWLVLDLAAVSVAGRLAPAARIAADYASEAHAGDAATALFDGRRLSVPGAAWANGVLANALDFDDGHRLTKGHPGATVLPAALAAAEATDATLEEFLTAVVVGYEVALRAGVRLHGRASEYHASGAWGALGAAAAVSRLLGLGATRTQHAIGLAEYHAPNALIMRSVADPAMTKDATGWGAFVGSSSAMLARAGFTALESAFLGEGTLEGYGERWALLDVYVKAYPCCRWTQPAIEAALRATRARGVAPDEVRRVAIQTFAAAEGLARRRPQTTEDAQYSLVWPVAAAIVRGRFGVDDVLTGFGDEGVWAVAERTNVVGDAAVTAAFPARRFAAVSVELVDGSVLQSGRCEARGEPGEEGWEDVVAEKLPFLSVPAGTRVVAPSDPPKLRLGGRTLAELIAALAYPLTLEPDRTTTDEGRS